MSPIDYRKSFGLSFNKVQENIRSPTIIHISKQLQDICKEIEENGQEDKNYWLTGQ